MYPTVEALFEHAAPGEPLLTIHRSLRSMVRIIAIFVISVIAITALQIAAHRTGYSDIGGWRGQVLSWLPIVPALIFLEITRRYHDQLFVLNSDRLQHFSGRISLRYSVPTLRYGDIRAIQVRQGIVGRILNFGDIEISTAAQEVAEVIFRNVYAPRDLALLIEDLRNHDALSPDRLPAPEGESDADGHAMRPIVRSREHRGVLGRYAGE